MSCLLEKYWNPGVKFYETFNISQDRRIHQWSHFQGWMSGRPPVLEPFPSPGWILIGFQNKGTVGRWENFSDFLRWFLEKFWQAERELLNHGNTGRKWEGKLIKHIWKWMFSLKDHERHILKDLERFLFQGHQCLCFSGHRSAWKPSLADARRNINSSRCGPTYYDNFVDLPFEQGI